MSNQETLDLSPLKSGIKPTEAIHKGEDPDKYHPFRVQLLIQESEFTPHKLEPAIYYVRTHRLSRSDAATMADWLWQQWEKKDKGIFTEFPDTRGMAVAEYIDEDDFVSAWKEVKKYNLDVRVAGDPEDPMAFTCLGRTDI